MAQQLHGTAYCVEKMTLCMMNYPERKKSAIAWGSVGRLSFLVPQATSR
jgi:hypothetical protein